MAEADILNKIAVRLARITTALEVKPASAFVVLEPSPESYYTFKPPFAVALTQIVRVEYNRGQWEVSLMGGIYGESAVVSEVAVSNGEEVCAALGIDPARLMTSTPAMELTVANK